MGLRPGQLDPQTAEVGHRLRELAGRKAYLRNFWYAAGGRPASNSSHATATLCCSDSSDGSHAGSAYTFMSSCDSDCNMGFPDASLHGNEMALAGQ